MIGRIFRKVKTILFKLFNWRIFKTAILYDVPRVYYKKRLYLEDNVAFNNNVFVHAVGGVTIKENCILSVGTTILSTGENIDEWVQRIPGENIHVNKSVIIGRNVWICANATICAGVSIADNCVIAAGSVVTKSLEKSGALYAGVPAKYIRDLEK